MEITVKMNAEEFEQFRAYQKDKDQLEEELGAAYDGIRVQHEALCSLILTAVEYDEVSGEMSSGAGISGECFTIKDRDALAEVHKIAGEWFC